MSGAGDGDRGYKVGYRKPPESTLFRPGVSGNPKGWPRKSMPVATWNELGVSDLLLATMGQEVAGTDRGQTVTSQLLRAIMQRMAGKALKDNVQAGRLLINLCIEQERQQTKERTALLSSAIDAQMVLDEHLKRCRAAGWDENEMQVHPRDIEIDCSTGEVRLYAALTIEQCEARAELVKRADEALATILVTSAVIAEEGDCPLLNLMRDLAQRELEHINQHLPSRFRRGVHSEGEVSIVQAALEVLPKNVREASQRWSRRMMPIFRAQFNMA